MTKKILNQGEFLRGNDVMTGLDQCGDSMEWRADNSFQSLFFTPYIKVAFS